VALLGVSLSWNDGLWASRLLRGVVGVGLGTQLELWEAEN